jgi:hypothetical protein
VYGLEPLRGPLGKTKTTIIGTIVPVESGKPFLVFEKTPRGSKIYEIGGGFQDQKGLGIVNIDKYAKIFGISQKTGIDLGAEKEGLIPTTEWKSIKFKGDAWRVGDTYNTAIGQYGFQVTPLQMVRAVASNHL